jgi:hypothetical protein
VKGLYNNIVEPFFGARLPRVEGRSDMVGRLKANRFGIVSGVDAEEVSAFVARVESAEQSGHWE